MRPDWLWFAQSGHSYHWNCSNPLNNQSAQPPPITSPDTHTCQVLKLPFVVFLQLPAPEMLITVRDPKTCIFVCVMQSKFRQLSLKSSPGEEEDIPTPKISVPTKQKAFFLPQPQLWKPRNQPGLWLQQMHSLKRGGTPRPAVGCGKRTFQFPAEA